MSLLIDLFAGEITDTSNPALWLTDYVGGPRSAAGVGVNETKASYLSTYWACLKVLSEDVGKLPINVFRTDADGGKTRALDHPVQRLLHREPSREYTPFSFQEVLMRWAAGWGNGYAEIERDQIGRPVGLWPIHPQRVKVRRSDDGVWYRVRVDDAGVRCHSTAGGQMVHEVDIPAADMLHFKGPGDDGLCGKSVIRAAADAIGIGLAAQDFGASFFANGTNPAGVLTHPGTLDAEGQKRLRDSWKSFHQGAGKGKSVAVLEEGVTWAPMSVPPNEAQFLETRQFQVIEICRFFRMPPHKVQELGRATWANIESQNIEYVGDTLMPWLVRFQQEMARKLLAESESMGGMFVEFATAALLMGDSITRTNFYRALFQMGAISRNEIRSFERLNPIDGGDNYYMQSAMTTVDQIDATDVPAAPAIGDATMSVDALRPVIDSAAETVCNKERIARDRALDKHACDIVAIRAWADRFYDRQRDWMVAQFRPVALTMRSAEAMSAIEAYCLAYCKQQADAHTHQTTGVRAMADGLVDAINEATK
jgi:HK97 family phage portal protein